MHRFILFPVLLLGACTQLAPPDAGLHCHRLFAPTGVRVDLYGGTWDAGDWQVDVAGQVCTLSLPGGDGWSCPDSLEIQLDVAAERILAVTLYNRAPESVDVTLERDGEVVYSEVVAPTYEESEPNGEGCGTRRWAQEELVLD